MDITATKKLYEVEELLSENGGPIPLSRSGMYLMLNQGKVPSVRIGRRVYVPSWFIDSLLNPPASSNN